MIFHMKQVLIDLDDRTVRDLERVAPVKERKRAEFIRLAIRRAIDLALERETEAAYQLQPLSEPPASSDLEGWDAGNRLATSPRSRSRRRRVGAKRAA